MVKKYYNYLDINCHVTFIMMVHAEVTASGRIFRQACLLLLFRILQQKKTPLICGVSYYWTMILGV